jgi:glycosyltransferase involved in cell wall biosynthesis
MIYLNAEVISGLGEDTFWTWFKREFPSASFELPRDLRNEDAVLQYSTLGFLNRAGKSIALLWELYPEMKGQLESTQWDAVLARVYECAKFSTYRVVASQLMVPFYERFGTADVLPIGVDTDLFKPLPEKNALRDKYNIPKDRKVGIWCGTTHPMKGFPRLVEYVHLNPDIYWIIVWKWELEAGHLPSASNFIQVPQQTLCELMNAADFFLCCGRLRPFYMVEWEAMACNLPIRILDNMQKDFVPSSNPRDDVFRLHWDRKSTKKLWADCLAKKGITW